MGKNDDKKRQKRVVSDIRRASVGLPAPAPASDLSRRVLDEKVQALIGRDMLSRPLLSEDQAQRTNFIIQDLIKDDQGNDRYRRGQSFLNAKMVEKGYKGLTNKDLTMPKEKPQAGVDPDTDVVYGSENYRILNMDVGAEPNFIAIEQLQEEANRSQTPAVKALMQSLVEKERQKAIDAITATRSKKGAMRGLSGEEAPLKL